MAEKKKAEVKEAEEVKQNIDSDAYLKERVPFYAFKDNGKYKDDIVVGVNGRLFRIKRGETVMIPRYVYNVLMNSMQQDAKTADYISEQEDSYRRQSRAGVL